ncbi:MAG: hypothetical protein ACI8WB_003605 [Phenylobacterium sp.]|jgi:hypothetical protein
MMGQPQSGFNIDFAAMFRTLPNDIDKPNPVPAPTSLLV